MLSSYCVKSERIRSYSGPHFPAFGLNTERYGVSLRIQSECRKMRTRINPNTDTCQAVSLLTHLLLLKTIYFVLSSPSWTDSLLSTNQSNTFANSLLKTFSISVTSFCWQKILVQPAYRYLWVFCKVCWVSFMYSKNNEGPNSDPWKIPQFMIRFRKYSA